MKDRYTKALISKDLPSYRGYLVIDPFAYEANHGFVLCPYALKITDSKCFC